MPLSIVAYLSEYDIQGDESEIPLGVNTVEEWEKFKQSSINDFIGKFAVNFEKFGFVSNAKKTSYDGYTPTSSRVKGYNFSDFGKGTYADNIQNKRLNRVGLTYDKAEALKDTLKLMLRNKQVNIRDEGEALKGITKRVKKENPELIPKTVKVSTFFPTPKEAYLGVIDASAEIKAGTYIYSSYLKVLGYTNEEIAKIRENY